MTHYKNVKNFLTTQTFSCRCYALRREYEISIMYIHVILEPNYTLTIKELFYFARYN